MPKGGRETSTLLERCIKEFQDVSKYENDERYLNVWLKYVSDYRENLFDSVYVVEKFT